MPGPSYTNSQRERFLTMMLQKMQGDRFGGMNSIPPEAVPPVHAGGVSQQRHIQMPAMPVYGSPDAGPMPMGEPMGGMDPMSAAMPSEAAFAPRMPTPQDIAARIRAKRAGGGRVPTAEDIAAAIRAGGL